MYFAHSKEGKQNQIIQIILIKFKNLNLSYKSFVFIYYYWLIFREWF